MKNKNIRKIELTKSYIINENEFFTHPALELREIINKLETMSIASLLYKIEELYLNTNIVSFGIEFLYNPKEKFVEADNMRIRETEFAARNKLDFIKIREIKNTEGIRNQIPHIRLQELKDYILFHNKDIINTYFNEVSNQEERFNIYNKIIKDNKMDFFKEKIKQWKNGIFIPQEAIFETIEIESEKYYNYIDGSFKRGDEDIYWKLDKLNNMKYYLENTEKDLKKEAFILVLHNVLCDNPDLNIELSPIVKNKKLYLKHRFPNIKQEDLYNNQELAQISSFLTELTIKDLAEIDYFGTVKFGELEMWHNEKINFFQEDNTISINYENLNKDFLNDFMSFFITRDKKNHYKEIIKANKEKSILNNTIGNNGKNIVHKNRL